MTPTTRLCAIEIEGFRGFAERRRLDLDADAIVIRGDNGTGKTSLIDAMLWLICGELAHLAERTRGLRKGADDVVCNRFNPAGARVTIELIADGLPLSFTRTGNQANSTLTAGGSDPATATTDASALLAQTFGFSSTPALRQSVLAWGILRQDHIRAALDEAGGALHERLAGIVGLEQVTGFAAAASQASRDLVTQRTAARRTHKDISTRHREAAARHEQALAAAGPDDRLRDVLREGIQRLQAQLAGAVKLSVPDLLDLDVITELGRSVAEIRDALEVVSDRRRAVAGLAVTDDDPIAAAQVAVTRAQAAAEDVTTRTPARTRLAVAALDLLGDTCPVCGQAIDEVHVRRHLEEILAQSHEMAEAAQRTRDELARAQTALAAAEERARVLADAQASLTAAQRELYAKVEGARSVAELDASTTTDVLTERLQQALGTLRALYRDAGAIAGAQVGRLAAETEALEQQVGEAQQAVEVLDQRIVNAKRLEHAAHETSKRIIERALQALQPSFAEVFYRLRPNPAFTELDVRQDIMNNKNQVVPVVRDIERGIDANPVVVFSEGQLNVVALSYFLGMALNAREAALPFLILDDPLQALDVIAILGFSDLARRVREHRQFIVTTHDRRFADVLVRKLSPRDDDERLIIHDFEGWTREGPLIRTTIPELAQVSPLLRRQAS